LVLQLKDAEPQMVDEVWEEGAAVVDDEAEGDEEGDEAEDEDEEREEGGEDVDFECDALDAAADCGNAEEVEEDNI
jgi:hypothetical protein